MGEARQVHARALLEICWLQWVAQRQWEEARRALDSIALVGDLPFMVSSDSADVWANQSLFSRQATVGTPPDAFSETGQDWGLPVYVWDAMRADDFGWLRARGRRMAAMFDGFRIDHLVGLYRAWTRPLDKTQPMHFEPADEAEQRVLGDDLVRIFKASGAEVIAEDLGSVPDFVRASIGALGVPGFKVLKWERHWNEPGQPPIDPRTFPALSVATAVSA